jgi:hypothetical protein
MTEEPNLKWAVMRAHTWERITVNGLMLKPPPEGPHRFIPLFETRDQAIAWAGSDEHVTPLVVSHQPHAPPNQHPEPAA